MAPGTVDISSMIIIVLSVLCLLVSLAIVYPLSILPARILIEIPKESTAQASSVRYRLASNTPEIEGDTEANRLLRGSSEDGMADTETLNSLDPAKTFSIWQAWRKLWAHGPTSAFRALPAQAAYLLIYEATFIALGGSHTIMQILTNMADETSGTIHNQFSPLLIIGMVTMQVVLLPLDITITRQIIGEPDDLNLLDHLRCILFSVGGRALIPLIIPQVLHVLLSMLLQYLNLSLHKLYVEEYIDHLAVHVFLAITEIFWRLCTFMLFVVPVQAVLYRAESSFINIMPPFSSRIAYAATYTSLLQELRQIGEEELIVSGTRYGKYLRFFKVLLCISVILTITFAIVLFSWDSIGIL